MNYLRLIFKWLFSNRVNSSLSFILFVISGFITSGVVTRVLNLNLGVSMFLCLVFIIIYRLLEDLIRYFFERKIQNVSLLISIIPGGIMLTIAILINSCTK